jgi:hypothetical protein
MATHKDALPTADAKRRQAISDGLRPRTPQRRATAPLKASIDRTQNPRREPRRGRGRAPVPRTRRTSKAGPPPRSGGSTASRHEQGPRRRGSRLGAGHEPCSHANTEGRRQPGLKQKRKPVDRRRVRRRLRRSGSASSRRAEVSVPGSRANEGTPRAEAGCPRDERSRSRHSRASTPSARRRRRLSALVSAESQQPTLNRALRISGVRRARRRASRRAGRFVPRASVRVWCPGPGRWEPLPPRLRCTRR